MTKQQKHFFNFLRKCNYCKQIWLKVIGCDDETICGERVFLNQDELLNDSQEKMIKVLKNEKEEIIYQINESLLKKKNYFDSFLDKIQSHFQRDIVSKGLIKKVLFIKFGKDFENLIIQNNFQDKELDFIILDIEEYIYNGNIACEENQFLRQLFNEAQYEKDVGCGKKIIWREMLPLSEQEINELLSPELMDYLADQEQLRKDETEFINREYKSLINQEIKNQIKKIKVINNKNQNQEQQILQQI